MEMGQGFAVEEWKSKFFEGIQSIEDLDDAGPKETVIRAWFWSRELEEAISRTGTKRLYIWSGWPITDSLAFLAKFDDQLMHLAVLPDKVTDLSAVSELHNLISLRLRCAIDDFDFARLDSLRTCSIEWENVDKARRRAWADAIPAISRCPKLQTLGLSSVPLDDLRPLGEIESLRVLHISDAPLRALCGVERLKLVSKLAINAALLESLEGIESLNVQELLLSYLPRLRSVRDASNVRALRVLWFLSCKKIADLDELESPSLEVFEMEACGQIPSIAFLRRLPNLRTLRLRHTSVADGALSIVNELPILKVVEFVPYKKHYRPAQQQVERGVQRGLMNIQRSKKDTRPERKEERLPKRICG